MSKPGRNAPCYCGSGKKYKQCHLKIDQAAEREARSWKEAARFLRRDLLKFARDDRFAEDFATALPQYWNDFYELDNAEEMSQDEALRFFDWFVFDYQPDSSTDGRRLIERYHAEKRDDLSVRQQEVLDAWLTAGPADAWELAGYEGQTLRLKNFTSGQEMTAFEPSGRGVVEIGELILTRLVKVHERHEFGTTAAYLPAAEITDLADKIGAARAADAEQYPDTSHDDFMRRHNVLLIHHALKEAENQGRPPVARLNPNRPDKKTQTAARQMKRLRR